MKNLITFILVLFWLTPIQQNQNTGSFIDSRNGRVYKTIQMNEKTWMAENLEVMTFRNGDTIPLATSNKAWADAGENGKPACCYYANKKKNGPKLGLLYNWYAANDPRGIAPEGWRLPSSVDLASLLIFLGNDSGIKLKSKWGWYDGGYGTDDFGFDGKPSGIRLHTGEFGSQDSFTEYWLDGQKDDIFGYTMSFYYKENQMTRGTPNKWVGCSIRCVKDK